MKRIDNPELKRRILDHLASLYKIKEVRESNHLSSYITCRTRSFLDQKGTAEPTDQEVMLFALGYGLQDVLTPKDASAPVVRKDGIIYSPDMILTSRLNEIKTTRKSAKYHYLDDSLPVTWLDYMMGGCYMMKRTEYDLIILYMMGDYCLAPDTRILRADLTWDSLERIKVGDRIIGVDEYAGGARGARRKLRYTTVQSLGYKVLPSRRLYLSNGRVVTASTDHMWLVQMDRPNAHSAPDWIRTGDLVEGDRIRQLCEPWDYPINYDEGWLAGFLDGEGDLENEHGIRLGFSQKNNIAQTQALRISEELGIDFRPASSQHSVDKFRTPDMAESLKVLGAIRPVRLLEKLNLDGVALPQHNSSVRIERIDELGEQPVIAIGTDTKTLIAEGLVSHNSPPFPQVYAETVRFDEMELEDNWQKILGQKTILDDAVDAGTPPEPFKNCYDWECKYCRYNLVCQTIARTSGVTMSEEQIEEDKKLWS